MSISAATEVGFDPALPGMSIMLDPQAMGPVLARSFDGSAALDVRIRFLRYKPATNLVVHYDVGSDGHRHDALGMIISGTSLARRAAKPESVTLARRVAARVAADRPLAYEDDVDCLVQWYPLDLSLPALAMPPIALRRLIAGARVRVAPLEDEPQRLAYKARRRAVLRVDGYVLKLYAKQGEFERALCGQRAASAVGAIVAPRLKAALPEQMITVQSALYGRTVPSAADVAADAGTLLALLHRSSVDRLRSFSPVDQLDAAAASARLVAAIAPRLRPPLERLLGALEDSRPPEGPLVPCHGDFNARQLLVTDGALAVTDFDAFCKAAAALDGATYAAYLVRGDDGDLDVALAALADLVEGYGRRPPHLEWYFATMILRRAPRPFRYFEPDWPRRVEEMVASSIVALRP